MRQQRRTKEQMETGSGEMTHNYSRCPYDACEMCSSYGDGYSRGKDKALFECALAVIHMRSEPDCACSACTALKSVPLPTYDHDG